MTSATLEFSRPAVEAAAAPRGDLALALQEAFTVAVRLRSNRQVAADSASFRAHVKQLLAGADRDARAAGYNGDTVRLAIYAYVAFLDESVLNSNQPMFADWPRQPLQEEVFGDHMAGETFFRYLTELMGRADSVELADLLEVYQLCMLLGFRGRYGTGDNAGLQTTMAAVQEKILRVRGARRDLSPSWALPAGEVMRVPGDPWVKRLVLVAGGLAVLAVVLYVIYSLLLHSGAGELQDLASRIAQ